eukprot:scaffold53887_cov57-Phaeocystis_antarctica.AAC.9
MATHSSSPEGSAGLTLPGLLLATYACGPRLGQACTASRRVVPSSHGVTTGASCRPATSCCRRPTPTLSPSPAALP